MLAQYNCANLRELNTTQQTELEKIKFVTLCGLQVFDEISKESVAEAMEKKVVIDSLPFYRAFLDDNKREPTMDELRQIYCLAYICEEF
jgi:hypothetical protein